MEKGPVYPGLGYLLCLEQFAELPVIEIIIEAGRDPCGQFFGYIGVSQEAVGPLVEKLIFQDK